MKRRPRLPAWLLLSSPAIALSSILVACLVVLGVFSLFAYVNGSTDTSVTSLNVWATSLADPFFWQVFGRTVVVAVAVTVLTVGLGYVTALALWRTSNPIVLSVASVILAAPLVVSIVVRAYGWLLVLGDHGVVNVALQGLGLERAPTRLIYDYPGVIIALVQSAAPFAVFPIWASLRQISTEHLEAASDLGSGRLSTFRRVVLPLSMNGVIAAAQIVFLFGMGSFVTPILLGGGRVLLTAELIFENETNLNWPLGAVQAIVLITVSLLLVFVANRLAQRVWRLGAAR